MRHCVGDEVDVYQSEGPNLADLLRDVADTVEQLGHNPGVTLDIQYMWDEEYFIATLYRHL